MMLKDRITKLNAIGMGSHQFVTRDEYCKEGKKDKCFIAVKTMKDLPRRYFRFIKVKFIVHKSVIKRKM